MITKPILSILIPTKNREEFSFNVIQHILKIKDDRFQLIVHDNSDVNKLEYLLADNFKDSRLKYFYSNEILSFVENFSLGISKCDGEYITIIGDDDGINPLIIDIASWASNNGIEAITPTLPLIYYWPESGIDFKNDHGRLTILNITCNAKFYNAEQELIKLLKNGCQNYLSYNLAKVYHGMIKKSILDEIKSKAGNYIGGLSPDIYLSVAASVLVKNVLIIDYPLTISGICKKSGSADSATGKHTGILENAPHFKGHINYMWSNKVPRFYSVETIWGDSALAALNDLKKFNLIKHFRVDVLSIYCLKLYPQYKYFIIRNLVNNLKISEHSSKVRYQLLNGYIHGPFFTLLKKIKNKLFNKKSVKFFDNIPTIEKAAEVIQKNLENKNKLFFDKIHNIK